MAGKRARKYWSSSDGVEEERVGLSTEVGNLRIKMLSHGVRVESAGPDAMDGEVSACIVPVQIILALKDLSAADVKRMVELFKTRVVEAR